MQLAKPEMLNDYALVCIAVSMQVSYDVCKKDTSRCPYVQ